jgi:uncharacterized membrane protein (UPF0127 family)
MRDAAGAFALEARLRGGVILGEVEAARTPWRRARGLLGRGGLERGRALYLAPCGAIHTFFMRFALDLVFVDSSMRVVRTAWNVPPWRMAFGGSRARGVFEMQAGWFPRDTVSAGDEIALVRAKSQS